MRDVPMPMSTEPIETPIQVGDTVRLRGAAALMVVEVIRPDRTSRNYMCICRHLTDSPTGTATRLLFLSSQFERVSR